MEENSQMEQQTVEKPRKGKWSVWVVLAILILVLIVLLVVFKTGDRVILDKDIDRIEVIDEGLEKVIAKKNVIVPNFPEELLFDLDVIPEESYSFRYLDEGFEQPVLVYNSKLGFSGTVVAYVNEFTEDGWEVVNPGDADTEEIVTNVYARRDTRDVNVTIRRIDENIEVTIATYDSADIDVDESIPEGF